MWSQASAEGALLPARGPVEPLTDAAARLLAAGEAGACLALCSVAVPHAVTLGDERARLHGEVLGALALLQLSRPDEAAVAAAAVLGRLGDGGDDDVGPGDWRALALGVLAVAQTEQGSILGALDPLADALALLERAERVTGVHLEAATVVADALRDLSMFDTASVLIRGLVRRAVRQASGPREARADGAGAGRTFPAAVAVAVRAQALTDLLWAARLELVGEGTDAAPRVSAAATAAEWMHELARVTRSDPLSLSAATVEAYAVERLGEPALAAARLPPEGAPLPGGARRRVVGIVTAELVRGVVRARAAAAAGPPGSSGSADLARRLHALEQDVDAAAPEPGRRSLREELVDVALADLAERAAGAHPAARRYRAIAASSARRLWEEREARAADLRHRILRRDLAARRARTAGELLRDPLTGVGNRRRLDRELEGGGRRAVLFVDVDRFKGINDLHGHVVGDAVLQRVARLIGDCCRAHDVLLRYGGDEFVVLLTSGGAAEALALRVLDRVRGQDWSDLVGALPVTVSVGVSHEDEVAEAVRGSDAALLAAKRAGRDTVVTW